jgi:hypothetical protein
MITNEKILELASEHLYCNVSVVEWSGKSEDILKFAQRVSAISYNMGFGDGWKDCKVSYRISSYSVDPQ